MKRVICVVGPTASGKTALAVNLALALDGEVVSVDSMQLYAGMNVGTAKPTEEEMRGVPHHMLSVCPPTEAFSAGKYAATLFAISIPTRSVSYNNLPFFPARYSL